jgi:NADPH-dependent ferric siderophore reductase
LREVRYGEVVSVEDLTPVMRRVVLGGEGLSGYEPTGCTDEYINGLFVPPGAPYTVPFDVDEARASAPEHRPRPRRYTVRAWDPGPRHLTLDFVVHGEVGYAGRWAANAVPGERLQFLGPSGGYAPAPGAGVHLMVGDESALPAIAASLAQVPAGVPVFVVAVVDDADHELALTSPGDLRVTWVHRASAPDDDKLVLRTVEQLELPPGEVQVFVHGEAGEVRAVRRHLVADRGIDRDGASISPYWRRHLDEERWREVKREWLAASDHDV